MRIFKAQIVKNGGKIFTYTFSASNMYYAKKKVKEIIHKDEKILEVKEILK